MVWLPAVDRGGGAAPTRLGCGRRRRSRRGAAPTMGHRL